MDRNIRWKVTLSTAALAFAALILLWNASMEPGYFTRNFVASLWADMQSTKLTINILSNVPGMKPWLATVSLITGIPLVDIHIIPFGAAIRALLYAAFIRRITTRIDLAAGAALVTLLYPWAGWGYNSMFVHSIGGFLFLSIVLLFLIASDTTHDQRLSIAGVCLIIALFLFDYTASVWAGIMLVMLFGVAHFRPSLRRAGIGILAATVAILYSLKTTILSYIGLLQDTNPVGVILGYFTGGEVRSSPYEYVPESTGLGLSSYVYLLIAFTLLGYGAALGYVLYRERSVQNVLTQISTQEYIIGSALLGGGIATTLYTFLGRFTQFFIFVTGPLIGIVAVWYAAQHLPPLQKHQIVITAIIIVSLVGFVGTEFTYQMYTGDIDQYSDAEGEPVGTWLAIYSESPTVKTDLLTAGRMRMAEEHHDGNFNWTWYDEESYAAAIEGGDPGSDYVVINFESSAGVRAIGGWTRFESFGSYEEQINSNSNMNRVYCDGTYCVYI